MNRCRHLLVLIGLIVAVATPAFADEVPATRPAEKRPRPTLANVSYGPHARNVMDVWIAKSAKPTPVLIAIHGGGFRIGRKNVDATLLRQCLDSGISVVAIGYRFSTDAIAPAPFLDGGRAVQFVRVRAKEWNLDPTRVATTGSSAGGGMSLWLAFHDDLADAASADPIARESTRVTCAIATNGQSTYDPRAIKQLFPEFDVTEHPAIAALVGAEGQDLQQLKPEQYELYEEVSPVTHITLDDPPVLLVYDRPADVPATTLTIGIHHPRFGTFLQDKLAPLGVACEVVTASQPGTTPIEFLRRHFGLPEMPQPTSTPPAPTP